MGPRVLINGIWYKTKKSVCYSGCVYAFASGELMQRQQPDAWRASKSIRLLMCAFMIVPSAKVPLQLEVFLSTVKNF